MTTLDRKTPFVIGLTGNIATGKSTVLEYLAGKGAYVIDADKVAHRTMMPDGAAYEKIVDEFGAGILTDDGNVDRKALGTIVFEDRDALARLEAIVHPATFELTRWEMSQSQADIIILEAIKLLESGRIITLCDDIWVVTSRPTTQMKRLTEMRGMDETEVRNRMAAQSPQAEKVAEADHVIDNDSNLDELYAQLDRLWDSVTERIRLASVGT